MTGALMLQVTASDVGKSLINMGFAAWPVAAGYRWLPSSRRTCRIMPPLALGEGRSDARRRYKQVSVCAEFGGRTRRIRTADLYHVKVKVYQWENHRSSESEQWRTSQRSGTNRCGAKSVILK